MVIRPWAYATWERIQSELDARIKAIGVENAYFPLLIPESYLRKEADHVEGFSPELAVVTYGGGKQLEEPVVVRPTSETIINASFTKRIDCYRDLPLLVNNWSNIVRWELRPRVFLRTTEFLWQEGHTAHASEDDAHAYAMRILRDVYEPLLIDLLALPSLVGMKTRTETFAGALRTWTLEGVMRDGKIRRRRTLEIELGRATDRWRVGHRNERRRGGAAGAVGSPRDSLRVRSLHPGHVRAALEDRDVILAATHAGRTGRARAGLRLGARVQGPRGALGLSPRRCRPTRLATSLPSGGRRDGRCRTRIAGRRAVRAPHRRRPR